MKHETRFLVVLVVMVSLGLALAGCAGAPAAPPPATSIPTPAPPTPTPVPPTPTPIPPTPIPPTSTPSITLDDLTGVWLATKTGMDYVQFNQDGTYRHAKAIPWLEMAPVEVGQFRLEGTTLTFIAGNDSQECRGQSGSYEVEMMEPGRLQLVLQEDACQYRANYRPGPRERMPPTPAPGITQEDLVGIWTGSLTVGTDRVTYVFQFNEDGTWRAARGEDLLDCCPAEGGQFELEGTSLAFITSDESAFCKGQTGTYQVKLAQKDQLQFVLLEDACSPRTSIVNEAWSRASP
jgi:hypothetical protein